MIAGLVASVSMGWTVAQAAFSATATNGSNSWTAGTVVLANETASVLFNVGNLKPGETGSMCVVVTYNGNLTAPVKLYASASAGALKPYVDLTVELGTGGNYASCTGFVSGSTASGPETLTAFAAARTSYTDGAGVWTPTGAGQTKVYRFTYTMDGATPDVSQAAVATATFTWEARNS